MFNIRWWEVIPTVAELFRKYEIGLIFRDNISFEERPLEIIEEPRGIQSFDDIKEACKLEKFKNLSLNRLISHSMWLSIYLKRLPKMFIWREELQMNTSKSEMMSSLKKKLWTNAMHTKTKIDYIVIWYKNRNIFDWKSAKL